MPGWIKLHRSLLEWVKASDPDYMAVWVRMLLLATHTPIERDWGGKTITLNPGQFITSRKSLSEQSGVSESKIERILERFRIEHQIEQQTNSVSRVITISYWSKYQETGQPNEQPPDSDRTLTRSKEQKKPKKKEIKEKPNMKKPQQETITIPLDPEDEKVIHWFNKMCNNRRSIALHDLESDRGVMRRILSDRRGSKGKFIRQDIIDIGVWLNNEAKDKEAGKTKFAWVPDTINTFSALGKQSKSKAPYYQVFAQKVEASRESK